ncbi:hypothetical protein ACFE04_008459 [Oxalis oulophora]
MASASNVKKPETTTTTVVDIEETSAKIFEDFTARRTGFIKALTTESEEFFNKCDPERENLCLYAFPDGTWEVHLPLEQVPTELPEPALGINFARDGMPRKEWISTVASHSDSWLLAIAFFFAAAFNLKKSDRKRLFRKINNLPTVSEVVIEMEGGSSKKPPKAKTSAGKHNNDIQLDTDMPKLIIAPTESQAIAPPLQKEEEKVDEMLAEVEQEKQMESLCGVCEEKYASDEFWICCDSCETWFHGKCVNVTPSKAGHIKEYKCPLCCNKRARVPRSNGEKLDPSLLRPGGRMAVHAYSLVIYQTSSVLEFGCELLGY